MQIPCRLSRRVAVGRAICGVSAEVGSDALSPANDAPAAKAPIKLRWTSSATQQRNKTSDVRTRWISSASEHAHDLAESVRAANWHSEIGDPCERIRTPLS